MYTPFYLTNINFVQYPALDSLLLGVGERLTEWFAQEGYLDQLAIPFSATAGTESWTTNAQALRQSILGGNYSIRLEIRSNAELNGALGAYSATGTTQERTIYLNGDWLVTAGAEQVQAVLLEELGHDFDQYLNDGTDSAGDEGELFAQLVLNEAINPDQISQLKQQSDATSLLIDGQITSVETASGIAFIEGQPEIAFQAWYDLYAVGRTKELSDNPGEDRFVNVDNSATTAKLRFDPSITQPSGNNVVALLSFDDFTTTIEVTISRKVTNQAYGFYAYDNSRIDGDPANDRGWFLVSDNANFLAQASQTPTGTDPATTFQVPTNSSGVTNNLLSLFPPDAVNDDLNASSVPRYVTNEETILNINQASGLFSNDAIIFNGTYYFTLQSFTQPSPGGTVTVQDTNNNRGAFSFNPVGAFDFLAAGAQTTATFTYTISNAVGNDTATVTIYVNGLNDVPVLSGDNSGNVVEDGTLTDTGSLTALDVDTGATQTWSIQGASTGTYGSLALTGNSGTWT